MTETVAEATPITDLRVRWHRPLLWLSAVMVLLTLYVLIARFVDAREVTGLNQWDKPLKFALSTIIYAVTWSWLIGQLQRSRRVASAIGTVIAIMLAIELTAITGAAAAGTTSHFNVSSPLATTLFSIMGVSITVLWVGTFVVSIILLRNPLGDGARTIALCAGALISVVGLGLGYLMTSPTAEQLDDFRGIAGAHTVGIADGGPGLPILGWSTVAGDLRIPHFVGMHALQAIPLALIALELLSRRVVVLRNVAVRSRLVWIAASGYLAVLALLTVQSLRGQSVVQPDAATLVAATVIACTMIAAAFGVIARRVALSSGVPRE